jgi:hypothetical protein
MFDFLQSENFLGDVVNSDILRIASKKYNELADDARVMKGWTKSKCAEVARTEFPDFDIKNEQVYEWFEGKGDPRTSFSKVMEWVLGISLPPQCYWNAGKR